jgi:HD superfamily phosphodiesterase
MAAPAMEVTSEQFQALYSSMSVFVDSCMSGHDPSHNPAHVHRVVNVALTILQAEQALHPTKQLDAAVVKLAALLHDIGDRKYLHSLSSVTNSDAESLDPKTMVEVALLKHGSPVDLASKVQTIVSHVSYTKECKDPSMIRRLIDEGYPELAVVQDADRLDAIGAIGIGRTFTFLGAQGRKFVGDDGKWEMNNSIEHFGDKLEKLEGMMKTETGKTMAGVRTERLRVFRGWWEEEMGISYSTI